MTVTNGTNTHTVHLANPPMSRSLLTEARSAHDSARRYRIDVRRALNGLDMLGMSDVRAALDRAIEPFVDASLDACSDYERAVNERDERIDHLKERAAEHRAIVRERDAVLAAAVRDADRRARRSGRHLLTLAPWVEAAAELLPMFSIDDEGRLVEEPF